MKLVKMFTAFAFAAALCMSVAFADVDKSKFTAGGCCDKAAKAGKECEHKCCVKAAKEGKVCEKCNPAKKEEKK